MNISEGFHLIPDHMHGAVERWVNHGIAPESFLTAVLCNDLREAVAGADSSNARMLDGWVKFFYNHTPSACWGSPDKFTTWKLHRGLEGVEA